MCPPNDLQLSPIQSLLHSSEWQVTQWMSTISGYIPVPQHLNQIMLAEPLSHSMEFQANGNSTIFFFFLTVGWLLIHICRFSPENQLYHHQLLVPSVITPTVTVSSCCHFVSRKMCMWLTERFKIYTRVNVIPVYHYKYLTRKSYTLYW